MSEAPQLPRQMQLLRELKDYKAGVTPDDDGGLGTLRPLRELKLRCRDQAALDQAAQATTSPTNTSVGPSDSASEPASATRRAMLANRRRSCGSEALVTATQGVAACSPAATRAAAAAASVRAPM